MELKIIQASIQESKVDTLIVNLFEGVSEPGGATGALDKALGGAISEMIANGDLTGKAEQVGVVYPRGSLPAQRVLVVGLGKASELSPDGVRRATAVAIQRARDLNARHVATMAHGGGVGGLEFQVAAQATVEGCLLGLYHYAAPRQKPAPRNEIESLTLVEFDAARLEAVRAGALAAQAIMVGVYLARDLVELPPNMATPTRMAAEAERIAEAHNMKLLVGDREWAAEHNMGAFLAVAKGAGEPPKFIVLEHNGERQDLDAIVLVGKGITFDSGGISLKPSEKMDHMKSDMAGAAAVLATMKVVGLLDLPLRVIGITPCTENMPDAFGYRPADIITASNGKTIEIISTDAEGRMILADALVYASRYQPRAVVDLATLTGACVIALGSHVAAGLFCNDDALRQKLFASGEATHERLWPMPLYEDYRRKIRSLVADMMNSGGRNSGVGSSAYFLKEFTDYPWAHLDIAGMALITERADTNPYQPLGATGFGVRLLVDFLRNWS
ncbi:MAG: leucyl aminopeptidase [Anaerolineales bacterium]|nr:leucyl aminopeptidase [Anaerolineales bacterium]